MTENLDKKLIEFDPDLPPNNLTNKEAAKQRGLRFDYIIQKYFDKDGCPIRDKYGKKL